MAIKNPNTGTERYKARFIVQVHKDREREFLFHTSKTVRYRNIRRMLTLSVSLKLDVWFQDVTKSYVQGQKLSRNFYLKPTLDFKFPEYHYLKLLNPLYSLSKSKRSYQNN